MCMYVWVFVSVCVYVCVGFLVVGVCMCVYVFNVGVFGCGNECECIRWVRVYL